MKNKQRIRLILVYTIYLLVLFAVQTTWPSSAFDTVKPNLLLLLVVLCGYQFGFNDGLIIGLIAGLLFDYANGRVIGVGMLIFMTVGIIASSLFKRNLTRSILPAAMTTVICSLIYEVFVRLLILMTTVIQDLPFYGFGWRMFIDSIIEALLKNLLFMVPLFVLLRFLGPYRRSLGPGHVEREGSSGSW